MGAVEVTFFGVRGSTPYAAPNRCGFGGNTCCVVLQQQGEDPIILDLGSGLFGFAESLTSNEISATALLSHVHWDHIAGLPFFAPVLCPGGSLRVVGPPCDGQSLREAIDGLIRPPYFPVTLNDLCGSITVEDLWDDDIALNAAKVATRPVPHTDATSGYRIETERNVVVYIPDHQQPGDRASQVAPSVLELCDGADLLIHDGQYPQTLFEQRSDWGHSTPSYALEVARQSGVAKLALFSHDPIHDDSDLIAIETETRALGARYGIEVIAAREGMTLVLQ